MAIYDYFKPYYIQEYVMVDTGFPPPWHQEPMWTDGTQIEGWFQENTSSEMMVAAAQGIKTISMFWTYPKIPLHDGDVLRDEDTGFFIRIIGDDLARISLEAEYPHKKYKARVIERSELDE